MLKTGYLNDNVYFLGVGVHTKERMTPETSLVALSYLKEEMDDKEDGEPESTTKEYKTIICKNYKFLEVWHKLICKRFGDVARNSMALKRLYAHLQTRGGLRKVAACTKSGMTLHGTSDENPGIVECRVLVKEFEKCLAGSDPPAPSEGNPDGSGAAVQAGGASGPGVSGPSCSTTEAPDKDELMIASCLRDGDAAPTMSQEDAIAVQEARLMLDRIEFYSNPADLVARASSLVGRKVVVLIDAATSRKGVMASQVDVAFQIEKKVKNPKGFAVILVAGYRLDLFGDLRDKLTSASPENWDVELLQLTRSNPQNSRCRPMYEFVTHAPFEKGAKGLPSQVRVGRAHAREKLRQRCTERSCTLRPEIARGALGEEPADIHEEIPAEDKDVDIQMLKNMMDEAQSDEELPGLDNSEAEDEAEESILKKADASKEDDQRDYIVELFPFGRPVAVYESILRWNGSTPEVVVVLSSSAHPSPWVASRLMGAESLVCTKGFSTHSFGHGKEIALGLFLHEKLKGQQCKKRRRAFTENFIQGPDFSGVEQVITPYDVTTSALWHDGLNQSFPQDQLDKLMTMLVQSETDHDRVYISGVKAELGRGLVADRSFREGERIVNLTSSVVR